MSDTYGALDLGSLLAPADTSGAIPPQGGPLGLDRFRPGLMLRNMFTGGGAAATPTPTGPSPEALAATLAAAGKGPQDVLPQLPVTEQGATVTSTSPGLTPPTPQIPALGDSLRPRTAGGPFGGSPATNPNLQPLAPTPASATSGPKPGAGILESLKGVQTLKPPEPQKVATPAAPRPTANVKTGQILALLEALGATGTAGGLRLPPTLGAALGGR
jgi:hypothetical protein